MVPAADFARFKREPLVMATAYDFPFAQIMDEAGVDVILVGDSLANVVLGLPSTRDVDMGVMTLFVAAVARGARNTHILADMPFGSYDDPATAVANGRRFLSVGAHSVKLEGPQVAVVSALTKAGVPVIGHLGLMPQTAKSFRQVGRSPEDRNSILRSADELVRAGAFAILLEHLDFDLAAEVTRRVPVPTIGIGAGKGVDGQVLVLHDFLGLGSGRRPPFVRAFADLRQEALNGTKAYCRAVRERGFP